MRTTSKPERSVRAALRRGDVARAVSCALRGYGAEVFGFLVGVVDDKRAARDVYARVEERLAEGLPAFGWSCSLRTLVYAVARGELRDFRKRRGNRADPSPDLVGPAFAERPYRRPAARSAAASIRRALSAEDRELLVLRIDRGFGWRELAITEVGDAAPEVEIERATEEVRRRFGVIKQELARAIASGALGRR